MPLPLPTPSSHPSGEDNKQGMKVSDSDRCYAENSNRLKTENDCVRCSGNKGHFKA